MRVVLKWLRVVLPRLRWGLGVVLPRLRWGPRGVAVLGKSSKKRSLKSRFP